MSRDVLNYGVNYLFWGRLISSGDEKIILPELKGFFFVNLKRFEKR